MYSIHRPLIPFVGLGMIRDVDLGGGPYRGTFTAAVFTTWYFTALGIFSCENFKKEIQVIHSKKINVLTHYNAKVLSITLILGYKGPTLHSQTRVKPS